MDKLLDIFFGNLRYIPAGLNELSAPIDQFINNIFHSTVFRILYFIPFAVLKLLSIIPIWYFKNFMNNSCMLQTPAQIVLFVYLIPAVVIIGLIILLSANDGLGWHILLASPIVFVLFPLFVLWGIVSLMLIIDTKVNEMRRQKQTEGVSVRVESQRNG